jgi:hypothetical protein
VWICGLNGRQSDGEIENAGKNSRVVQIFLTTPVNKRRIAPHRGAAPHLHVGRQAARKNYLARYPNALVWERE